MRLRRFRRSGFTLVELVVSLAIMTILLGAMTSAVLMASRALPDEEGLPERTTAAIAATERISRDLALATSITLADEHAVEFTVPDRGHGDAGPETIEYTWSGVAGDPLEFSYNACDAITLCEDVQEFSLGYTSKTKTLAGAPRVLLVVDDADKPDAADTARRSAMESSGFSVSMVSDGEWQSVFDESVLTADVAYISETVLSSTLGTKLRDTSIGVVIEEGQLYDEFGLSSGGQLANDDSVEIIDSSHEITSVFPLGDVTISSSVQDFWCTDGTVASGMQILGERRSNGVTLLAVVDVGGTLRDGSPAPGRRVKLPWGNTGGFDFSRLNADGLTMMRRSIVWAAAPVGVGGVEITLQVGSHASGRIEMQVQLLNVPEVQ